MKPAENHDKFLRLRNEFPYFTYQSYSFHLNKEHLSAEFCFDLSGKFIFRPKFKINKHNFIDFEKFSMPDLDNFVFHIGMIELISYWKCCCSPVVNVVPFHLDISQVEWWKKLYHNGLGEFFYLNGISSDRENFMAIISGKKNLKPFNTPLSDTKVLIPVGGGKDSAVTLELFKNRNLKIIPFAINPRPAINRTINQAGYSIDWTIVVERTLDPLLLDFNRQGFLNGHTPFSAMLAFYSVLAACLSGTKYIALSNESSANQSTVPDSEINHQYSKSYEFEKDLGWYLKKYIHPEIEYFSFLRPVNELQIARLFSRFPQHFNTFRSCNNGSKTDSWCGKCAKCLFTYCILSPFISQQTLDSIFNKNLLNDSSLKPVLNELSGITAVKPFDCVGTPEEVVVALKQSFANCNEKDLPVLIRDFYSELTVEESEKAFKSLLHSFNTENYVPPHFVQFIKSKINEQEI